MYQIVCCQTFEHHRRRHFIADRIGQRHRQGSGQGSVAGIGAVRRRIGDALTDPEANPLAHRLNHARAFRSGDQIARQRPWVSACSKVYIYEIQSNSCVS